MKDQYGLARGVSGVARGAGCLCGAGEGRLINRLQLGQQCVAQGDEHVKKDALHVAVSEARRRWWAGQACELMFLSFGADGLMLLGEACASVAQGEGGRKVIGERLAELSGTMEPSGVLVWTDDVGVALASGVLLMKGEILVQCVEDGGVWSTVVEPNSDASGRTKWEEEPTEMGLVEWEAHRGMARQTLN